MRRWCACSRARNDYDPAAELLEKLLKDELKVRSKENLVQSQSFAEKLKNGPGKSTQ